MLLKKTDWHFFALGKVGLPSNKADESLGDQTLTFRMRGGDLRYFAVTLGDTMHHKTG